MPGPGRSEIDGKPHPVQSAERPMLGQAIPRIERQLLAKDDIRLRVEALHRDLEPRELDLRAYFGDPQSLKARLRTFDLVWVMGGNSFILRRAMRASGFDRVIRELLEADAVAYGGYAAGAVVAGPTLRGLELMDDPFDCPDGYDESLVWTGLGLTPFTIVPHYRSLHPEAAAAEKVVSYMAARKARYRALSDGEVIVRVGTLERLAS